jgi:hypothetical protein
MGFTSVAIIALSIALSTSWCCVLITRPGTKDGR